MIARIDVSAKRSDIERGAIVELPRPHTSYAGVPADTPVVAPDHTYNENEKFSVPPPNFRYVTLAEARSWDCNLCGGCCTSTRSDAKPLHMYTFGRLPKHQWKKYNGGVPLIIPLTKTGAPRVWREEDAKGDGPGFVCSALHLEDDGTALCGLFGSPRHSACGEYPIFSSVTDDEVLKEDWHTIPHTTYQRSCTWVDIVICPEWSPFLRWRDESLRMPVSMSAEQWSFASYMFNVAWRLKAETGDVGQWELDELNALAARLP